MITDWSLNLREISSVSENGDDLKDDEEEEQREKEINGMLMSAFDDLSSVSGDEEDDDLSEEGSYDNRQIKLPLDKNDNSTPILTSTPRCNDEDFTDLKFKRYQPKNSPIKEVDEHQTGLEVNGDSGSFHLSSDPNSIEKGRATSLCSEINNNNKSEFISNNELSSKHIQFLLDENEELRNESKELENKLLSKNSDYESIKYKSKQLENKLKVKESEIISLSGKINAMEIQLKAESETKNSIQRQQAVNQATIDTLEKQIADLTKSDSVARIRENHEAFISKLRSDYETEIFNLNEELANLRWELDSNKQELITNREFIKEKDSRIECVTKENESLKLKLEKAKVSSHSNKEINDNETENKLKQLERLNKELIEKLANLQTIDQEITSSIQDDNSEIKQKSTYDLIINELKVELERTLDTAELRRKQSKLIHDQLFLANKEIEKLRDNLKAKDKKISDIESCLNNKNDTNENELFALKRERDALKSSLEMKDIFITQLKDFEKKYYICEKTLTEKLDEIISMKSKYQCLLKDKKEIENTYQQLLEEVNSKENNNPNHSDNRSERSFTNEKLKDLVQLSTELWKNEIEKKLSEKFEIELNKIRETFKDNLSNEKSIREKVIEELNNEIIKIINLYINLIENGSNEFFMNNNNNEFHSKFIPMGKLWLEIVKSFKEKETLLINKTNELNEARSKLEHALIQSRLNEGSQLNDNEHLSNDLRNELETLREKSVIMENKLIKYKRHYHLLLKKHENEINNLKEQLINEKAFELKEQYHLDSEKLLQQLTQVYISSLEEIKNHADNYLVESNKKSMQKISSAVLEYHKTIAQTITEREQLLKSQLPSIVK